MRRVVVTGMGIVSSIGTNKSEVLASLREGRSGIEFSQEYQALGFRSQVHGPVRVKREELIALNSTLLHELYFASLGVAPVAKGRNLKETMAATREVMDPKFSSFAIYEHCLPFNVSRAFDEASGIDDPVIWTDKRDQEMWAALQGG